MWDNLSTADIEQAKQQLKLRREQILSKHLEEIRGIDAEQTEIETLDRLAEAFARKFKDMTVPAPEPVVTAAAAKPPAAEHGHGGKRSSKPVHVDDEPNYAQTNFDVFSRALSQL